MLSFHHLRNNIFQGTFGTTLTIILLFWEIFTETFMTRNLFTWIKDVTAN